MTLEEFKRKFYELKNKGYVKSLRRGPTGIGYTLETYLEIEENNLALPDISGVEIKAHRSNSNNLITLFTFNRKVWQIPPLEAIRKYGNYDRNGRLGLYYTMSSTPNSAGLFLSVENSSISVRHISGEIIAIWDLTILTQRFQKKYLHYCLFLLLQKKEMGLNIFIFTVPS